MSWAWNISLKFGQKRRGAYVEPVLVLADEWAILWVKKSKIIEDSSHFLGQVLFVLESAVFHDF